MLRRARLWLLAAWCCSIDASLTLVGQPRAYWAGQRGETNEANPLARMLLEWHPLAFAAGTVAAALAYALLLARLPLVLARLTSLAIVFAHSLGVAMWCVVLLDRPGYAFGAGWLLLASWLVGWSWRGPRS
jgi:hypothetical protein